MFSFKKTQPIAVAESSPPEEIKIKPPHYVRINVKAHDKYAITAVKVLSRIEGTPLLDLFYYNDRKILSIPCIEGDILAYESDINNLKTVTICRVNFNSRGNLEVLHISKDTRYGASPSNMRGDSVWELENSLSFSGEIEAYLEDKDYILTLPKEVKNPQLDIGLARLIFEVVLEILVDEPDVSYTFEDCKTHIVKKAPTTLKYPLYKGNAVNQRMEFEPDTSLKVAGEHASNFFELRVEAVVGFVYHRSDQHYMTLKEVGSKMEEYLYNYDMNL